MGDFFQPWHLMVLFFIFGILFVVPAIFYILTLQKTLDRCGPVSRTMEPGMVWLLIIPFVNLVFHLFVVLAISKSVANELSRRGIPSHDPQPGQSIGLAMCICGCCTLVPFLGFAAALAHLVLWVIYWVKVGELSRQLSIFAGAMPVPGM
jgi:hypothetical protein